MSVKLSSKIRKPTAVQPTAVVYSGQGKVAVSPISGSGNRNVTQLAAGSVPTAAVKSGQSKIPH